MKRKIYLNWSFFVLYLDIQANLCLVFPIHNSLNDFHGLIIITSLLNEYNSSPNLSRIFWTFLFFSFHHQHQSHFHLFLFFICIFSFWFYCSFLFLFSSFCFLCSPMSSVLSLVFTASFLENLHFTSHTGWDFPSDSFTPFDSSSVCALFVRLRALSRTVMVYCDSLNTSEGGEVFKIAWNWYSPYQLVIKQKPLAMGAFTFWPVLQGKWCFS